MDGGWNRNFDPEESHESHVCQSQTQVREWKVWPDRPPDEQLAACECTRSGRHVAMNHSMSRVRCTLSAKQVRSPEGPPLGFVSTEFSVVAMTRPESTSGLPMSNTLPYLPRTVCEHKSISYIR